MKKSRKPFALVLCLLLLTGLVTTTASALCAHSSVTIHYNNYRYCEWTCGFLTGQKQNVWNEVVTYHCNNGTTETSTNYNVRNGNCC